jgi:hypothetical protein
VARDLEDVSRASLAHRRALYSKLPSVSLTHAVIPLPPHRALLAMNFSTELALSAVVLAGTVAVAYLQYNGVQPQTAPSAPPADEKRAGTGKKSKKKKGAAATSAPAADNAVEPAPAPIVVPFPAVVPGEFAPASAPASAAEAEASEAPSAPQAKKAKKKKAKKPAAAASEGDKPAAGPSTPKAKEGDAGAAKEEQWTRVESRRRPHADAPQGQLAVPQGSADTIASDAITTSVTGTTTPTTERTDEESEASVDNRKTLAEKLLPKPRKTGVDE